MRNLQINEERGGLLWLIRIGTLLAIAAVVVAIGVYVQKGDVLTASFLLAAAAFLAGVFAWSWTGFLFTSLEWAKRYVQGAEGEHRHEWYAFKSQRVRVFLDETDRPWFALNEIAFILDLKDQKQAFRHYGPQEYGTPASASEVCLSESGLRRLIKYSTHPDAGALGNWLEREVLRMLKNRKERQA